MTATRRSPLSVVFAAAAFAVLAAPLALPAQAGTSQGGVPFGANSVTATNVAAGKGNLAQQHVFANQMGGGAAPWMRAAPGGGLNDTTATNVAAGLHNRADQQVMSHQMSGGRGHFAPGANSANATNVAAGLGNHALQGMAVMQGPGGFNRVDGLNAAAGEGNFASQQIMAAQR